MLSSNSMPDPVQPLLTMRGITKRFQNVLANDRVDLDIFPGEIHALLGENGAGKSTLMKILYGFYRADAGEICLQGKAIQIRSPQDARRVQIGMVFQNLNLIPAMTVAENIALFLQDLPVVYQPKKVNEKIEQIFETIWVGSQPGRSDFSTLDWRTTESRNSEAPDVERPAFDPG